MSLDRDRNARIHSSRAAYLNSGRVVGNPDLGITSGLPVTQGQSPRCEDATSLVSYLL